MTAKQHEVKLTVVSLASRGYICVTSVKLAQTSRADCGLGATKNQRTLAPFKGPKGPAWCRGQRRG